LVCDLDYNGPENYIVKFTRDQLAINESRLTALLKAISAQPRRRLWAPKSDVIQRRRDSRHRPQLPIERSARHGAGRSLIERRYKIGRVLFNDVLPLDDFAARDGKLVFDDLAARYGFREPQVYSVQWFEFDNRAGARDLTLPAKSLDVPADPGEDLAAVIRGPYPRKTVTVYLRDKAVGIDRT
jgi:hypothetical protein